MSNDGPAAATPREPEHDAGPATEGGLGEDWLATILGLAILALALLGLIPDALLW